MDDQPSTIERRASRLFDAALYGVLFIAPLFMGGRGPFGKFVFVCCVSVMALAWIVQACARRMFTFRLSGAEWIIAAGAVLLFAQLIPLPESCLLAISPHLRELLPIWFSSADPDHFQIGTWNTISLAPHATRQALAVYLAYAMLFMLVVQRVRTVADIEWMLRSLAYGTVAMAVLGLTQFLTGNGKFLWFYEHPFRTTDHVVKGPFQNQNHFAHMLALGIGPLLWMLLSAIRDPSAVAKTGSSRSPKFRHRSGFSGKQASPAMPPAVLKVTFAIGLVALAAMLTFSRGGFLAFTAATFVALGIYRGQNLWHKGTLKISAGIGGIVTAALCLHGYEPLARRLSTLRDSGSLEELSHGRRALWDAMNSATESFWRTGTGIGSHADVYPVYMKEHFGVEFTHGESGYLPLLMEGGIAAMLLLGCGLFFLACRLLQSLRKITPSDRSQTIRAASLAAPLCGAIAASLVHSIGDFVWYISACMSWTIIILALICRLPKLSALTEAADRPSESQHRGSADGFRSLVGSICAPPEGKVGAAAKPLVLIGFPAMILLSVTTLFPPARAAHVWNEYRRIVRDTESRDSQPDRHEIELLKQTLAGDPGHQKANLLLAQTYWQLQNDGGPIEWVSSSNPSDSNSSVTNPSGFNDFSITALAHNPLQGRAYAFAIPTDPAKAQSPTATALLDQALRVRRHDAIVHMLQGKRLLAAGQIDQGFEHWRFAFNHDPEVRASLIKQLQPIFPADFLLERLQPENAGLWQLFYAYRKAAQQDNLQTVAKRLISMLHSMSNPSDDPTAQAQYAYQLHSLYVQVNETEKALESLQTAAQIQPENYHYRRDLGIALYRDGRHTQAAEHLKWCHSRRRDQHVENLLKACVRLQLAGGTENTPR